MDGQQDRKARDWVPARCACSRSRQRPWWVHLWVVWALGMAHKPTEPALPAVPEDSAIDLPHAEVPRPAAPHTRSRRRR